MSPYEHGEVFVLQDGYLLAQKNVMMKIFRSEADLDLGNYERFVDVNLSGLHNITTGKIYKKVLE